MTQHLTRQQLYDMVWAEPLTRLSKRLGISDVGLSKVCKKANIPTPGLGYWAKLAAGRKLPRPALPPRGPGMLDRVTFAGTSRADTIPPPREDEAPIPEIQFEDLKEVEQKALEAVGKVTLPKTLTNPHRVIARILKQDEQLRAEYLASSNQLSWNAPLFDSQRERRRLRILNAIFLALAKLGYGTDIDGREARGARTHIGDQHVSFKLDWAGKTFGKEKRYTREADDKQPYKLRLELDSPWVKAPQVAWEDRNGVALEDQLTEIVVRLIVAADKQLRDGIKWHQEWDRQQREYREKLRKEREMIQEKARVEALHQAAAQWRKACEIREYVSAMQKNGNPDKVTVDGKPLLEWCVWAIAQADTIDPTIPSQ